MDLKQKPIVHLVRHARYRKLGVLFDCWEPGYGQSFLLGEKFNLEGGRGPYITHILTSEELRATQTAAEAFEALERTGIEIKEHAVLRGDFERNATNDLREIIETLLQHKSGRIEVVVVTHRRFIDNVLQRSYEEPDFGPTEFRSYVMNEDGTLTPTWTNTLPTQIQMIRRNLETEKDPNNRWTLEMRLSLEQIIEEQAKIIGLKGREIRSLHKGVQNWTPHFWSGSYESRYTRDVCEDEVESLSIRLNVSLEEYEEAWWRQKLARELVLLLADIEVTENDISFKKDFSICVEVIRNWNLKRETSDIRAYIRSQRLDVDGTRLSIMHTSGQMDEEIVTRKIQCVNGQRCVIAPFLKETKWVEKVSAPMTIAMTHPGLLNLGKIEAYLRGPLTSRDL